MLQVGLLTMGGKATRSRQEFKRVDEIQLQSETKGGLRTGASAHSKTKVKRRKSQMEVESVSIGGQIDGEEPEQEREYEIERAESGIYIRIQYSGVYVLVVLRRVDTTCRIQ